MVSWCESNAAEPVAVTYDQQYAFIRRETDAALDALDAFDPAKDDPEHRQELQYRADALSAILETVWTAREASRGNSTG
jgi:hypothetical protein